MCNEDGNVETVTGCLINTLRSPSTDSVAATYEFALYSTGYSLTKNQTDGSVSVRAYSTINYNTQNTPTEYLLTSVSGHWTILDSTVSVTNADLHYICSGPFPRPGADQEGTVEGVSNYFSYNTGFTSYVALDAGWSAVGAELTLDLQMIISGSTRTWNFTIQNLVCS